MIPGVPGWLDAVLVRADNPGPMTLSGTNTWVIGRDPAWVVDPGPALEEHVRAVAGELAARGGAGGIAVTHAHADHSEAVAALLARLPEGVRVVGDVPGGEPLGDGMSAGPLAALALPGHCPKHFGFRLDAPAGRAVLTGDAVLGEGSVFVSERMADYLAALERIKALAPRVLLPGHGPVVEEPARHLDAYLAHRLERERQVLAALRAGITGEESLLDAVWGPLPDPRRRAAAATLGAHLGKLRAEARLPG